MCCSHNPSVAEQIRPVVWSWATHWSVLSWSVAQQADITTADTHSVWTVLAEQTRTIIWSFAPTHPFVIVIKPSTGQCCPSSAQMTEAWHKNMNAEYWKNIKKNLNTENEGSDSWPDPTQPSDKPDPCEPCPSLHQHPISVCGLLSHETERVCLEMRVCLKLNRTVRRKSIFSDLTLN